MESADEDFKKTFDKNIESSAEDGDGSETLKEGIECDGMFFEE